MSTRRAATSLLVASVLVAILAGCGDDSLGTPPTTGDGSRASAEPPAGEPAPEGIEGVIAVTGLTNEHTEDPVAYASYPPLGGDHYPAWANCGAYTHAIPDEAAVHSLEHGVVWIAYRPDVAAADIEALQQRAVDETHILVSPYAGLRAPFVVTAWGRQLDLDTIDDPRLQPFIDTYLRAGDAPEPGARCTGGITP